MPSTMGAPHARIRRAPAQEMPHGPARTARPAGAGGSGRVVARGRFLPMQPDPASALARVDELAARMVAHAAPLEPRIATTAAELAAVYRLRYEVVIARGWGLPSDFPDCQERDAFDARAVQVGVWE